jgi:hypothetical protein
MVAGSTTSTLPADAKTERLIHSVENETTCRFAVNASLFMANLSITCLGLEWA